MPPSNNLVRFQSSSFLLNEKKKHKQIKEINERTNTDTYENKQFFLLLYCIISTEQQIKLDS